MLTKLAQVFGRRHRTRTCADSNWHPYRRPKCKRRLAAERAKAMNRQCLGHGGRHLLGHPLCTLSPCWSPPCTASCRGLALRMPGRQEKATAPHSHAFSSSALYAPLLGLWFISSAATQMRFCPQPTVSTVGASIFLLCAG